MTTIRFVWLMCSVCFISLSHTAFYQKLVPKDGPTISQQYGKSTIIFNQTAFVGAEGNAEGDNSIVDAVYVWHFNQSTDSWIQKQKIIPSDSSINYDAFGCSMDYDAINHHLVIGAWQHNSYTGAAYIFNMTEEGLWEEMEILISGIANDFCGWDVGIANNIVIVGCPGDDQAGSNNGAIYIFENTGRTWNQISKIVANDAGTKNDYFGVSVSISDNGANILVGAYQWVFPTYQGAAYIITKDPWWNITQRLSPSDPTDRALFGVFVDIEEDMLAIGASHGFDTDTIGKVYVFSFNINGTYWYETEKLTASDGQTGDHFGGVLALFNHTLIVDGSSIYAFEYNNIEWVQTAKISPNVSAGAGYAMSIWDNSILVCAPWDDTGGNDAGSAHIFTRYGKDFAWFPTEEPTVNPTVNPTINPTYEPTYEPTIEPTGVPTIVSINPTVNPSISTTEQFTALWTMTLDILYGVIGKNLTETEIETVIYLAVIDYLAKLDLAPDDYSLIVEVLSVNKVKILIALNDDSMLDRWNLLDQIQAKFDDDYGEGVVEIVNPLRSTESVSIIIISNDFEDVQIYIIIGCSLLGLLVIIGIIGCIWYKRKNKFHSNTATMELNAITNTNGTEAIKSDDETDDELYQAQNTVVTANEKDEEGDDDEMYDTKNAVVTVNGDEEQHDDEEDDELYDDEQKIEEIVTANGDYDDNDDKDDEELYEAKKDGNMRNNDSEKDGSEQMYDDKLMQTTKGYDVDADELYQEIITSSKKTKGITTQTTNDGSV